MGDFALLTRHQFKRAKITIINKVQITIKYTPKQVFEKTIFSRFKLSEYQFCY